MKSLALSIVALALLAPAAAAQSVRETPTTSCFQPGPEEMNGLELKPSPEPAADPFKLRLMKYSALAMKHRLAGLASYYSTSLQNTLTANGERYRHERMTAAHLTLPLGCWVELRSRATGKAIRVRVNDRGPYTKKFAIDLSQSAARALGVDRAEDRWVDIRIIALPGEKPLPERLIPLTAGTAVAATEVETVR